MRLARTSRRWRRPTSKCRGKAGSCSSIRVTAGAGSRGRDIAGGGAGATPCLFSEELGLVIEYLPKDETTITSRLRKAKVPFRILGRTTTGKRIRVRVNGRVVVGEKMRGLRETWEETSHRLERLQANPKCVMEEKKNIHDRPGPSYKVTFTPKAASPAVIRKRKNPAVAVIREEGSNSDREKSSACYQAGFDVWDVTMTDFLGGKVGLDRFRGMAFVGGFSYADVLASATGWAGGIRFTRGFFDT